MAPGSHASPVRPLWGRISAATSALLVTLLSVLGGIGLLPTEQSMAAADTGDVATLSAQSVPPARSTPTTPDPRTDQPARPNPTAAGDPAAGFPVPESGVGKRVVFDISAQRVWLVDTFGLAVRTYAVSGSLTDNLRPGTYRVYSTSRWAVGVDDSGAMQYFVRFARGARAAIGFHSIPVKDGQALQTRAELGTPQSHGCIRQWLPDAKALWDFAPTGTKVVVTA